MDQRYEFPLAGLMWLCGVGFAAQQVALLTDKERSAEKGEQGSAPNEDHGYWAGTAG